MEIRYGILQVAEALFYLHSTERLLHLNVCPQNVVVTKRGMWKLTGLCFTQSIGSDVQSNVSISRISHCVFSSLSAARYFLPARRYASAVFATATCPSVHPSVTHRYCAKTVHFSKEILDTSHAGQ